MKEAVGVWNSIFKSSPSSLQQQQSQIWIFLCQSFALVEFFWFYFSIRIPLKDWKSFILKKDAISSLLLFYSFVLMGSMQIHKHADGMFLPLEPSLYIK